MSGFSRRSIIRAEPYRAAICARSALGVGALAERSHLHREKRGRGRSRARGSLPCARCAVPGPIMSMACAAAWERSMMRPSDERAAVDDAHLHGLVGSSRFVHPHPGVERQRAVGGHHASPCRRFRRWRQAARDRDGRTSLPSRSRCIRDGRGASGTGNRAFSCARSRQRSTRPPPAPADQPAGWKHCLDYGMGAAKPEYREPMGTFSPPPGQAP